MTHKIEGIIPVMLTPFTDQGDIDYPGLERLAEWYLEKGADALFAICQSSEMQFLTLAERAAIGHFVVKQVAGRVPEVLGYPALAKLYHQRIGTFNSIRCRVITYDVRERFWALDAVLDKIVAGTEAMRGKIAQFSENL
jgi:hypothetical protein